MDPELTDELRRVVAELCSALADPDPPRGSTITLQATTFDKSQANQTDRDLRVITGE